MQFDSDYQQELLHRMTGKTFLSKVFPLLRADMFDPLLEPVVEEVLKRFDKSKKTLSTGQLRQLCHQQGVVLKSNHSVGDNSFDEEAIYQFACQRVLDSAFAKAHVYNANGKFDKAVDCILSAQKRFPQRGDANMVDILQNRSPMVRRVNVVSTGLGELDTALEGGVGGGDLAVILSPTSGGKTSFLVYLSCQAVLQGKTVAYLTLEVSRRDIESRARQCLTQQKKPTTAQWLKVCKELKRKKTSLQVWEFPPHSISTTEINSLLTPEVDALVVDYGDYLRTSSSSPGLEYLEMGHVYSGLKRVGLERKIPVWTASQVNRMAYEKEIVSVEDVEASLKKSMAADLVVSINRAKGQDKEPDPETGNVRSLLYLAKNRFGERFKEIKVTINWAKCGFKEKWWD